MTSTDANVPPGEWTHVPGTWNGSEFRLYVNGQEVVGVTSVGGTFPSAMDDSTIAVNIGDAEAFIDGNRNGFFNGLVDEVHLYSRAVTSQDIANLAGS